MRSSMALGLICLGAVAGVGDADEPRDRSPLASAALSADVRTAESACAALRAQGARGLDVLIATAEPVLARGPSDPAWARATRAIDRVSAQHQGWASRLYWHTDFAAALADAQESGRPILALRMLGGLDEPLSCANSRFFRVALYPDPKVGALLRERFVLYWDSERPAPRITIDYGDGRVVERTVTGNSLHEVLDADGRLVDAIPGMWGPAGFRDELERALELEQSLRGLPRDARRTALAQAHAKRARELALAWPQVETLARANDVSTTPRANEAAARAVTKSVVQVSMLDAAQPQLGGAGTFDPRLGRAPVDVQAEAKDDARLSRESRDLLRLLEGPESGAPGAGAPGDEGEKRFRTRLAAFEAAIAEDQIQNRYVLGRAIHEHFAFDDGRFAEDRAAFRKWIYGDVFLTPKNDPWLGLAPEDAFTGIERGGLVAPR